jgi:hypothetical protein
MSVYLCDGVYTSLWCNVGETDCRSTFVIDNDFQVFSSRQPRKNTSHKGSGDIYDSFGHRERRDSHRDQRSDQQQGTSRVYTPAQFENSLGKLQVYYIYRWTVEIEVLFGENKQKRWWWLSA